MSPAEENRFSDFTHDGYRGLLRLARDNYPVRSYTDFEEGERFVLWRHDVDYALQPAVELARIEAEEGVRATYFVLVYSEFYTLLEPSSRRALEQIRGLGHTIGLHFDITQYGIGNEESLAAHLVREREMLERCGGGTITAFAFHNPDAHALSFTRMRYAGLVNTYARYFREQVAYGSDSNGIWRHRPIGELLQDGAPRLQILTHAEWWTREPLSPRERLFRCLDARSRDSLRFYNSAVAAHGRANVFPLDAVFTSLEASLGERGFDLQMQWLRGEHALCFLGLWRVFSQRGGDDAFWKARALALLGGATIPESELREGMVALAAGLARDAL